MFNFEHFIITANLPHHYCSLRFHEQVLSAVLPNLDSDVNSYFRTLQFTFTFDSAELFSALLRTSFLAVYAYILILLITAICPLRFYERVLTFRRKTAFGRKSAFFAQSSDFSLRLRLDFNCILPSANIQTSFKV